MRHPMRAVIVVAVVLLAACGSPTVGTADAVRTQFEIEAMFAKRADALARGDRKAYDETYDPDRAALRRWQAEDFDAAVRGGGTERAPRVVRVEPFGNGYLRVYAQVDTEHFFNFPADTHIVRRYVRQLNGRWVITEPMKEELGEERTRDADASTLQHWAIDDDVAPLAADELRTARAHVSRFAPRELSTPLTIRLFPTAETLGPGWPSMDVASHGRGVVRIAPIGVGLDGSLRALSATARFVLRVAFADELREQLMPGIIARLQSDDWLREGWRFYAAGMLWNQDFFKPTCAGAPPPSLKQLSAQLPLITSEHFGVRYAHQVSLVAFLYERHGTQAYWDLLEAFRADADSRVTLPKVLKTTPDAFYTDWLVWAKKKYC